MYATSRNPETSIAFMQGAGEARELGQPVGPAHLLLGLLSNLRGEAYAVLARHGASYEQARTNLRNYYEVHPAGPTSAHRIRPEADLDDDREALSALGIDFDQVRDVINDRFGIDIAEDWGRRGPRGRGRGRQFDTADATSTTAEGQAESDEPEEGFGRGGRGRRGPRGRSFGPFGMNASPALIDLLRGLRDDARATTASDEDATVEDTEAEGRARRGGCRGHGPHGHGPHRGFGPQGGPGFGPGGPGFGPGGPGPRGRRGRGPWAIEPLTLLRAILDSDDPAVNAALESADVVGLRSDLSVPAAG